MIHRPNPSDYAELIEARERQRARYIAHGRKVMEDLDEDLALFRENDCEPIYYGFGIEDRALKAIVDVEAELTELEILSRQCRFQFAEE